MRVCVAPTSESHSFVSSSETEPVTFSVCALLVCYVFSVCIDDNAHRTTLLTTTALGNVDNVTSAIWIKSLALYIWEKVFCFNLDFGKNICIYIFHPNNDYFFLIVNIRKK